jgi:hypothetical protein
MFIQLTAVESSSKKSSITSIQLYRFQAKKKYSFDLLDSIFFEKTVHSIQSDLILLNKSSFDPIWFNRVKKNRSVHVIKFG